MHRFVVYIPGNFAKKKKRPRQISDVKTKHHPPEGTFTGSAESIARKVMKDANGDLGKAIRRITFYVNRAGENCSPEARGAKRILMKRRERQED